MIKKQILVAHPGAATSVYELVTAIERLGYQARLETGFYWYGDGWLSRIITKLPQKFRTVVERELRRRQFASLPNEAVIRRPLLELLYVLSARLFGSSPFVPSAIMHLRNKILDQAVARSILRHRPAAVICHDTSALKSIRMARKIGVPCLLNQLIGHQVAGTSILSEEAKHFPEWADSLHANTPPWLLQQTIREACEADYVLVPSDYVRETILAIGVPPEKIRLLPFGVRVDRFCPPLNPRKEGLFRLLYVGQISQRKGLAYLLEAMRNLKDDRTELLLVGGIVGSGRGLSAYDGLYQHMPNVPHNEVVPLFQSADIFVYPSLHEGSALAIFEAMATGLPIVTTPNAGSMVRDGIEGFIVPHRDTETLAARIDTLRSDAALRQSMGQAARDRALNFTWERYQTGLFSILEEALRIV